MLKDQTGFTNTLYTNGFFQTPVKDMTNKNESRFERISKAGIMNTVRYYLHWATAELY